MKNIRLPEEVAQEHWFETICKILGSWRVKIKLNNLSIEEELNKHQTKVSCDISTDKDLFTIVDEGIGNGVIDALYGIVLKWVGEKYITLETIKIISFDVKALIDEKKQTTSVPVEVALHIKNSRNEFFYFRKKSYSIGAASALAFLSAIEFFINSEIAFFKCSALIKDAKKRNREDLVVKYTGLLSEIVKVTDYSECVKIKGKLNGKT